MSVKVFWEKITYNVYNLSVRQLANICYNIYFDKSAQRLLVLPVIKLK